ncbi:MAG TPA: serine hydrolase domain-containing protein [Candidatus Polarisedimenticolaceae bacterium]|nr:serine hydrolase domain-containing protein [Candidatus Polarisedimenticolaceae bacterium]
MAAIQGTWKNEFDGVVETLGASLDRGEDIGASAAVYIDGEAVVDVWGGFVDEAKTKPWERDTIVNNFSTTKTMTALSALVLADRGAIDLNAPVAKYWPEFAAAGKGSIEVRQILSHTAGLSGWTEDLKIEDLYDLEKITTLLARQAPWWTPGTASGYESITFGPLVGEVIRRVTGKSLGRFFAEEVAGPLGADYHIGTGPEHDAHVSPMIQSSPLIEPSGTNPIADRTYFNPLVTPQIGSSIPWRRAELGGSNGHGNARSVGLVQSVLACGGEVNGVRLLSEAGCRRALEPQIEGVDLAFGIPLRWGIGYALNCATLQQAYGPFIAGANVAYWGGSGGSWVIADLDRRMTVAFVMNRHVEAGGWDHRSVDIVKAAYASLGR